MIRLSELGWEAESFERVCRHPRTQTLKRTVTQMYRISGS